MYFMYAYYVCIMRVINSAKCAIRVINFAGDKFQDEKRGEEEQLSLKYPSN